MKKEIEILSEVLNIHPDPLEEDEDAYIEGDVKEIVEAMDIYAKQEAIEFSEWVGRRYMRYATGWVPNWKRDPYNKENILTTETLYQIFKEEQK